MILPLLLALSPQGSTYTVTPTAPQHVHGVEADTNWTPAAPTLTLKNNHPLNSVNYTVSCPQNWITLSSTSGTILATKQKVIALTIDSDADSLAPGFHDATVTVTMGTFSFERHVYLAVAELASPGSGWTGATSEPAQIGSGDARCIARWNTVPHQTLNDDGNFYVGVVAFHIAGIDKVEFSVDNGTWVAAEEPTYNPLSQTWEYMAAIQRSDFSSDGLVEVRAIAYPNSAAPATYGSGGYPGGGYCRVLDHDPDTAGEQGLKLYVDAGTLRAARERWVDSTSGSDTGNDGSESEPFATIAKALEDLDSTYGDVGYGQVYLEDGNYAWGPASFDLDEPDEYVYLRPATGAAPVITSSSSGGGGRFPDKLAVHGVDLTDVDIFHGGSGDTDRWFWLQGATWEGDDYATQPSTGWVGYQHRFWIDSTLHDRYDGPVNAEIVRGCYIHTLRRDTIKGGELTVNCVIENTNPDDVDGGHADIFQLDQVADCDNLIGYGVRVYDTNVQGWHIKWNGTSSRGNDVAYVNYYFENLNENVCQIHGAAIDHLLLWHLTINDADVWWRAPESHFSNVSVIGSNFEGMSINANGDGLPGGNTVDDEWFDDNHYVDVSGSNISPGAGVTTGADNIDSEGFPSSSSALLGKVSRALVPTDAAGKLRPSPAAAGAFEEQ